MNVTSIEFVGAPGSGKTTLAAWLAGRRVPGSPARWVVPLETLRRSPRPGSVRVATILMRPGCLALTARAPWVAARLYLERDDPRTPLGSDWEAAIHAVRSAEVIGPRSDPHYRTEALKWLEVTVEQIRRAQAAPASLVPVLQEGLIQRSLSVLGASPDPSVLRALLRMQPNDVLVVHMQLSQRLLAERARARLAAGVAPRLHQGLREDEAVRLVLADAESLERTVREFEAMGGDVLHLAAERGDTSVPLDELGHQVLREVAQLR